MSFAWAVSTGHGQTTHEEDRVDPHEELDRGADKDDDAPEQETQHDQEEGVDTTPIAQTDLEQEQRGTTKPGD